jgi:ABC-type nitrate/sulfonate/bicarbonate transport system substrate-binding protein
VRLLVPRRALAAFQSDVAERRGTFRTQGVAVERRFDELGNAIADLREGRADVAVLSTEALIRETQSTPGLVAIAGAVNRAAFAVVVGRDVNSPNDLRGKAVASGPAESVAGVLTRRVMASRGLRVGDYNLVAFADWPVRAAAVANGTAGAALVDAATSARLQGMGFRLLEQVYDVVKDYQSDVLVVRADELPRNETRFSRLVRGLAEANAWIADPANHDSAVELLAETLEIRTAEATRVFDQYVVRGGAVPRRAEIEPAGVSAVIELMREAQILGGSVNTDRLINTALRQQALR